MVRVAGATAPGSGGRVLRACPLCAKRQASTPPAAVVTLIHHTHKLCGHTMLTHPPPGRRMPCPLCCGSREACICLRVHVHFLTACATYSTTVCMPYLPAMACIRHEPATEQHQHALHPSPSHPLAWSQPVGICTTLPWERFPGPPLRSVHLSQIFTPNRLDPVGKVIGKLLHRPACPPLL